MTARELIAKLQCHGLDNEIRVYTDAGPFEILDVDSESIEGTDPKVWETIIVTDD